MALRMRSHERESVFDTEREDGRTDRERVHRFVRIEHHIVIVARREESGVRVIARVDGDVMHAHHGVESARDGEARR